MGASEQRLTAKQDRAVEAIAAEFSELREETRRRMETMERRLDNLAPVIISLDARMSAFTRSVDNVLKDHDQVIGTLEGFRRIAAGLHTRIANLEKATGQHPQQ